MRTEETSARPPAERVLWAAVLMTAIEDAKGNPKGAKGPAVNLETSKARRWLTRPNKDFNEVCYLAGLDPVSVRERCQRMFPEDEAIVPSGAPSGKRRRGRSPHLYEYNGESLSLSEWADRVGLSLSAIRDRMQRGMTLEQAITTPKIKAGTHRWKQATPAPGGGYEFASP